MIQNTSRSFGIVAKCFHWGMAILILIQFSIAYVMTGLDPNPLKWTLFDLHKAIGLTIFILVGLRLGWRLINPVPEMPKFSPRWQVMISHLTFGALYLLMFLMPLSGLGLSLLNGSSVSYFGLFTISKIYSNPTVYGTFFDQMHILLSYVFIVCIGLHICAALYHYFILKDSVLHRMLIELKQ